MGMHFGCTCCGLSRRRLLKGGLAAGALAWSGGKVSAQSASLASQGPALLASRTEEALNERSAKMKETQKQALQKLDEIIKLGADKAIGNALTDTVKNIDDVIQSLHAERRRRVATNAPLIDAHVAGNPAQPRLVR